ncbi:beta-galactosidase [Silvibacterium dinghuense]|uniref:Beta-galactosidase n=1 Tax=Silvibacterium dinghuense TaxID=1560006 RepID=A0A4Q1S8G5_9BACT|nr:beta-galactosidase [Silvibacterium dinghuense]RXS93300.1 beta-galactosidase [Silvibacterium dinghuense]GGH04710.1 beta-galactosidase [Silvibacterium dinghuense]
MRVFASLCRRAAVAALCVTVTAPFASAQATQYADQPPLLVGAAWYPEQWPASQWEPDLERMEAAHIHLVRVGEFAWSSMEPREGEYHFEWLEKAIALAAKHHICVILGTPTAAPPAWLTQKYPETLRVDNWGRRDEHGNRQQFSFASTKYRELGFKIAEEMATRFGHNPDVVGWQLDNELAADSFDPDAIAQWHAYLKTKYGTIDNLNKHWATAYWSQSYNDFDQIPAHNSDENPALLLEWKHFVSETWKSYSENQIRAIRPHADKRQFITTNTMGWFDGFDSYIEHSVLDIAAWDDYISTDVLDPYDNGLRHDLTRGYKQKNFWVMETEPAFVNWRPTNNALDKGQTRDLAWQAIGHGSDAVEYWQWRAAPNGQEEYHGVLVGIDGKPVPVYDEVKQVGEEFEKTGKALAGTSPHSEVALINDFDSRWAIDFQRHSAKFSPTAEMTAFYRPLRDGAQAVDVISAHAPLDQYKLVVAPALNVLPQDVGDHLLAYVKQGGHLVLGPRSGMKDGYDALNPQRQPGPLADALGANVSQFYALDKPVPVEGDAGTGEAEIWAETIAVASSETKVLMRYGASNGWLDGQPAVVARQVGKGTITYIGAWLEQPLLDKLTASILDDAGIKPLIPGVPEGVEVCERSGDGKRVLIFINHTTDTQQVSLPTGMRDLLHGGNTSSVSLEKYGVAVLAQ